MDLGPERALYPRLLFLLVACLVPSWWLIGIRRVGYRLHRPLVFGRILSVRSLGLDSREAPRKVALSIARPSYHAATSSFSFALCVCLSYRWPPAGAFQQHRHSCLCQRKNTPQLAILGAHHDIVPFVVCAQRQPNAAIVFSHRNAQHVATCGTGRNACATENHANS